MNSLPPRPSISNEVNLDPASPGDVENNGKRSLSSTSSYSDEELHMAKRNNNLNKSTLEENMNDDGWK